MNVKIEGDEIVIRIPISLLPCAVQVEGFKVTDAVKFAEELVSAINLEDEEGTTPVHKMLDEAANTAIEDGAYGVEEIDEDSEADT